MSSKKRAEVNMLLCTMAAATYIMVQGEVLSFNIGQVMYRTFDVPAATLGKMITCLLLERQNVRQGSRAVDPP